MRFPAMHGLDGPSGGESGRWDLLHLGMTNCRGARSIDVRFEDTDKRLLASGTVCADATVGTCDGILREQRIVGAEKYYNAFGKEWLSSDKEQRIFDDKLPSQRVVTLTVVCPKLQRLSGSRTSQTDIEKRYQAVYRHLFDDNGELMEPNIYGEQVDDRTSTKYIVCCVCADNGRYPRAVRDHCKSKRHLSNLHKWQNGATPGCIRIWRMAQRKERHRESMKQREEQTTGRRAAPPGHCAAPPALCAPPPPGLCAAPPGIGGATNDFWWTDPVKRVTQSVRASGFQDKWLQHMKEAADQANETERLFTLMRRLGFQGYVGSGPRIKHPRRSLKSFNAANRRPLGVAYKA